MVVVSSGLEVSSFMVVELLMAAIKRRGLFVLDGEENFGDLIVKKSVEMTLKVC